MEENFAKHESKNFAKISRNYKNENFAATLLLHNLLSATHPPLLSAKRFFNGARQCYFDMKTNKELCFSINLVTMYLKTAWHFLPTIGKRGNSFSSLLEFSGSSPGGIPNNLMRKEQSWLNSAQSLEIDLAQGSVQAIPFPPKPCFSYRWKVLPDSYKCRKEMNGRVSELWVVDFLLQIFVAIFLFQVNWNCRF